MKKFLKSAWYSLKRLTVSLRILLLKPLKWLPINSEILGPPKGFYQSTKECSISDKLSREGWVTYQGIHPQQNIVRKPPGTLDENVHWKFRREYERELPETFVAVLRNGRFWVSGGERLESTAVITADDKILADVSKEFRRTAGTHSIFTRFKLPKVRKINGTAAILASANEEVYFHWMFDIVPRLYLLQSNIPLESIDYFVIYSQNNKFQKETLNALGIADQKIIESSKSHHLKADRLVVPSLPGIPGNPPIWAVNFLREIFLNSQKQAEPKGTELIYISRAKTKFRRVINEAEFLDLLKDRGFQSVALEFISVAEQAALFSKARIVVAPHGAGLTNIVFCQPGTKIVELFSPNYVNVCYWSLSNQLDLDYYYLLGEGKMPAEYTDPHSVGDDIRVGLDSLSNLLKLAGV